MWLSIVLVVVLVLAIFFYFVLYHPNYDAKYELKISSGELVNPVSGLSLQEAEQQFNESFIYYMLYSIRAYNLHNPALSFDTPKIEIFVDGDPYNAEISGGEIYVSRGETENEDIIIRTTKREAIKMLQDKSYVSSSFAGGGSTIELVAGKTTLFGKGYLRLYEQLTGKSITGSVIRIYIS